jgi:hypothetical protein
MRSRSAPLPLRISSEILDNSVFFEGQAAFTTGAALK